MPQQSDSQGSGRLSFGNIQRVQNSYTTSFNQDTNNFVKDSYNGKYDKGNGQSRYPQDLVPQDESQYSTFQKQQDGSFHFYPKNHYEAHDYRAKKQQHVSDQQQHVTNKQQQVANSKQFNAQRKPNKKPYVDDDNQSMASNYLASKNTSSRGHMNGPGSHKKQEPYRRNKKPQQNQYNEMTQTTNQNSKPSNNKGSLAPQTPSGQGYKLWDDRYLSDQSKGKHLNTNNRASATSSQVVGDRSKLQSMESKDAVGSNGSGKHRWQHDGYNNGASKFSTQVGDTTQQSRPKTQTSESPENAEKYIPPGLRPTGDQNLANTQNDQEIESQVDQVYRDQVKSELLSAKKNQHGKLAPVEVMQVGQPSPSDQVLPSQSSLANNGDAFQAPQNGVTNNVSGNRHFKSSTKETNNTSNSFNQFLDTNEDESSSDDDNDHNQKDQNKERAPLTEEEIANRKEKRRQKARERRKRKDERYKNYEGGQTYQRMPQLNQFKNSMSSWISNNAGEKPKQDQLQPSYWIQHSKSGTEYQNARQSQELPNHSAANTNNPSRQSSQDRQSNRDRQNNQGRQNMGDSAFSKDYIRGLCADIQDANGSLKDSHKDEDLPPGLKKAVEKTSKNQNLVHGNGLGRAESLRKEISGNQIQNKQQNNRQQYRQSSYKGHQQNIQRAQSLEQTNKDMLQADQSLNSQQRQMLRDIQQQQKHNNKFQQYQKQQQQNLYNVQQQQSYQQQRQIAQEQKKQAQLAKQHQQQFETNDQQMQQKGESQQQQQQQNEQKPQDNNTQLCQELQNQSKQQQLQPQQKPYEQQQQHKKQVQQSHNQQQKQQIDQDHNTKQNEVQAQPQKQQDSNTQQPSNDAPHTSSKEQKELQDDQNSSEVQEANIQRQDNSHQSQYLNSGQLESKFQRPATQQETRKTDFSGQGQNQGDDKDSDLQAQISIDTQNTKLRQSDQKQGHRQLNQIVEKAQVNIEDAKTQYLEKEQANIGDSERLNVVNVQANTEDGNKPPKTLRAPSLKADSRQQSKLDRLKSVQVTENIFEELLERSQMQDQEET